MVACAIHAGHELRPELAELVALEDGLRRYEEDPYTGRLTKVSPTRVVVERSRFEVGAWSPLRKRPDHLEAYVTHSERHAAWRSLHRRRK